MKKNFEVIEEGRLSKNEMSEVMGGYYCKLEKLNYYITIIGSNCPDPNRSGSFSACMLEYVSCDKTGNASCSLPSSYGGPTGPTGIVFVDPTHEIAFGELVPVG